MTVSGAKQLVVVIPSRTQPRQSEFLDRAIASIKAQAPWQGVVAEMLICLDDGAPPPALVDSSQVRFVTAATRGQSAAMNAGAAKADADYIGFLEDDDTWQPKRLSIAMQALDHADFTSTTQLERDQAGNVLRINDFPTPSSWVMPMETWRKIGPFDETYRWHLDNDWLGRLAESGVRRMHVVEASAPLDPGLASQVRPWLFNCMQLGGPQVRLRRHASLVPLVNRLVHLDSGMGTIARDAAAQQTSAAEQQRLLSRYGRIPW